MGLIQYAVLNDIHFPFHSVSGYKKAIDSIAGLNDLRGIFLNGDIAEFESVSSHAKGKGAIKNLKIEVDYLNEKIDFLEKKFKVPIIFVCGNHCHRVFRYIRDNAPELFDLVDIKHLIKTEKRKNFSFIDYGPRQLIRVGVTDLYLRHEPLGGGPNPAKTTAENSSVDLLFGHTHIHQVYYHKRFGDNERIIKAYSGGWLGDHNYSCFDYRGSKDKWCLGFNIIETEENTAKYEYKFVAL